MKKSALLLAVIGLLGLVSTAGAADKPADKPLPATIQLAVTGGMKVEAQFPAVGGLNGWVLSQGIGKNMVVFTTADGEAAIAGNMVNAKGENLTKTYLEKYAPKADYAGLWKELTTAATVGKKTDKPRVYMFFDANCGYCQKAYTDFRPYEKAGLSIRYVPVAFLRADSVDKAAFVLQAKDQVAAMEQVHSAKALPSDFKIDAASKDKLASNGELMKKWGFEGTPVFVYMDGKEVKVTPGMPPAEKMEEITGMKAPSSAK